MSRRDFLVAAAALVGGVATVGFPQTSTASTLRNSATGSSQNFSIGGITGTAHNGFEYVPYSYLTHTGAVSSAGFNFGPGSVRFRLTIMGPQRTVAEFQGTNSTSGHTVWASHTTYDVNGGDGGYFTGIFWPDIYIANQGFVWAQVQTYVSCAMYGRSRLHISTTDQIVIVNGESMLSRTGDAGNAGLILLDDYFGPNFISTEECLHYYQNTSERVIPVYDELGENAIDQLTIKCGIC